MTLLRRPLGTTFPAERSALEWIDFEAQGFSGPMTGVIYQGDNPPTCGMPLGGSDIGCLDIKASGLLGMSSLFNSLAPRWRHTPDVGAQEDNMRSSSGLPRCMATAVVMLLSTGNIMAIEPVGSPWPCHIIDDSSRGADGVKLADITGDGLMDIAVGWEEGGLTRIYFNPGPEAAKSRWPAVTVGRTPDVEDAVFVDLDRDGRCDVISCCEGRTQKIFVHWAPKDLDDLHKPDKWEQAVLPDSEKYAQQWMFAMPMQVDGRGGMDLIAASKGRNAQIGWFEAPDDGRDLPGYRWHPISSAGWIMSILIRDMNGNGHSDIVVSDRKSPLRGVRWLENPGPTAAQMQPWKNHFMGAREEEVMFMDMADLDGDGLEDAVVAVKDMKIVFLKRLEKHGLNWRTYEISADFNSGTPKAVVVVDVNNDKQPDLVLTTENAEGKHGALWLEYRQTPMEEHWKAHQISGIEKGIKYDRIEMLDLDGDGDLDLLTCEESEGPRGMGVFWYENPFGRR